MVKAASREQEGQSGPDGHALLLSPSFREGEWERCTSFLYPGPEDETSVIAVTFTDTPRELVRRWEQSGGGTPKHFGAIFANSGQLDSKDLTQRLRAAFSDEEVLVGAAVVNPSDLTQINIEISEMLGMWDAEGERIALCLSSLTSLLQYTEIARVFKFLHATVNEFKAAAARTSTHYHLDPDAVDDRDVARVRTLMDEVIDVRDVEGG